MARGRIWTPEEDDRLRALAKENAQGISIRGHRRRYHGRFRQIAEELGRSYAAVLKRASRIGADSYRPRRSPELRELLKGIRAMPRKERAKRRGGGRGRPWTEAEDEEIRRAARFNATQGPFLLCLDDDGKYVWISRLKDLADQMRRTPAAVRKRASRIGARSLPRHYDSTDPTSVWRRSSQSPKRTFSERGKQRPA